MCCQKSFEAVRGETHEERLESFCSGQARDYDPFRAAAPWDEATDRQNGFSVRWSLGRYGVRHGGIVLLAGKRAESIREIHLVDSGRYAQARFSHPQWCNSMVGGQLHTVLLPLSFDR